MDNRTARAWVIFVFVAMVTHGIGELFNVYPLTFLVIMLALVVFTLKYIPDKK